MAPMEATIGMNTARRASSRIEFSKRPITEAARMAVARLIRSHTRRFGNTTRAGSRTVSSPAAPPRRWMSSVADDVDDVVDRDHPQQAMATVDHRDGHQVVLGDEPRDLLLVGLRGDAHRLLLPQQPDRGRPVR